MSLTHDELATRIFNELRAVHGPLPITQADVLDAVHLATDNPDEQLTDLDAKLLGRRVMHLDTPGDEMTAPGRLVLWKREDSHPRPWGVHWQSREDGGCHKGSYHPRASDALLSLFRRCGEWGM